MELGERQLTRMHAKKAGMKKREPLEEDGYGGLLADVVTLVQGARRQSARAVNAVMTATYWMIGRRIVEDEQAGSRRAGYGDALLARLAADLTAKLGKGFSRQNLQQMRQFYIAYPASEICRTASGKSRKCPTPFGEFTLKVLRERFSLPWSAYVRLIPLKSEQARSFYEEEALRGGWTVRQLVRQIDSQFYERTALSKNQAALLKKASIPRSEDKVTPEEQLKDPYILEFLGLRDEYSESDLEEALTRSLEDFLMELGGDFAFIGRQRRLRVGDEWYRVDLLFYHRRLRCLVIIDLKTGKFTHADAGQMHLYLNYAQEHWTRPDENPPVGLILCTQKDAAVAKYALDGLPNKVLAAEYRTILPDENLIAERLERTRMILESRRKTVSTQSEETEDKTS